MIVHELPDTVLSANAYHVWMDMYRTQSCLVHQL